MFSIALLSRSAGWRVTMTTEVGSETEVKEKAEESAAQPDQSEKAAEENAEVANAEGEEKDKEKEKDGKEGKGIARYLPTWLKKQKSQSQVKLPFKNSLQCHGWLRKPDATIFLCASLLILCWVCFCSFSHVDFANQGGSAHRGSR